MGEESARSSKIVALDEDQRERMRKAGRVSTNRIRVVIVARALDSLSRTSRRLVGRSWTLHVKLCELV